MSKTLRYDALVVRALALELESRFTGARLYTVRFARGGRTLRLATGRGTIAWRLHPHRGGFRIARPGREPGNIAVGAECRVAGVESLPDERVLVFRFRSEDENKEAVAGIVVQLFGTHADAFALDAEGKIMAALRAETGDQRTRGVSWEPPIPSRRQGIETPVEASVFRALFEGADPREWTARLLTSVGWTSPINAAPIIGQAAGAGEDAIEAAYKRYVEVCHGPPSPVLLDLDGVAQPYPRPLPGLPGEAVPDLVTAFARSTGESPQTEAEMALTAIAARRKRIRKRRDRLRDEEEGAAAEAAHLRRDGSLLLSQAHAVQRGQGVAELDDYAGGTVRIELDPALDAAANAEAMFDRARKRDRAAHRIPEFLRAAADEDARLARMMERIRAGEESLAAEVLDRISLPTDGPGEGKATERLPYRRYRSRNGLEIRVGRGARFNDQLTLRHSRPDDIWLHARDVGGAHVVLVWGRRDQNPPASDLVDAAMLAALHSRARTAATVPVDWTRRKYVRKPRKARPGVVTLERAKTLFVQPDAEAAERLRLPDQA